MSTGHEPRDGDARYRCRYCNKPFVVAIMTLIHEDKAQCPEAQQAKAVQEWKDAGGDT